MILLYKITMKNKDGKLLTIEVKGQNMKNAVYNARSILMGATIQFHNNAIYKDYTEVIAVEKIEHTEEPQTKPDEWCICRKCNGSGFIPKFDQYHGGICYTCSGLGKVKKSGDAYIQLLNK